jgi:hypothetical protein
LLGKLLAVPALRARYLAHVRAIASKWLDWERIAPLATEWQALIAADVQADTRKLYSAESFKQGVNTDAVEDGFRGPRQVIALKTFVEKRRAFLLKEPAADGSRAEANSRVDPKLKS